jgi:hypothetical protein
MYLLLLFANSWPKNLGAAYTRANTVNKEENKQRKLRVNIDFWITVWIINTVEYVGILLASYVYKLVGYKVFMEMKMCLF